MSKPSIFTDISNCYYQFTASEKKITNYILSHQEEVQYLSISDLAEACGVGDATISRFCRKLNLPSYNAFRLAVATSEASESNDSDQMFFSGNFNPNDTIKDMAFKIMQAETAAIKQTSELIDFECYRKAADALSHADRVFCMGQGGSMIIAKEVWHLFSTSFPNYIFQEDTHLQTIVLSTASPRDVLLLFSYSGATRDTADLLALARERQVKTILVTRFLKSPGARCADIILQCGSNEGPLQIGSTVAKMVQLFVADILFNEVCLCNAERAKEYRENVAEALAKLHL